MRKGHHRGGQRGLSIYQVLEIKAAEFLDKPETREFIEAKLREAHELIEERQEKVAKEMLDWRDRHVERWVKLLEEWELPREISQVTTVSGGPTETA